MGNEDFITITDSSDEESRKYDKEKSYKVPIIVSVESKSVAKKKQKPPIVTNIGECTLTLAKRRKTEQIIEIIDDSDDETQRNIEYIPSKKLTKSNSLFVTSSIETFHKNVSCSVNATLPITTLGDNHNIQTTEINISVSGAPNKRKSMTPMKENSIYNEKLNFPMKKEICCISLLDDSDTNSETESNKIVSKIEKSEKKLTFSLNEIHKTNSLIEKIENKSNLLSTENLKTNKINKINDNCENELKLNNPKLEGNSSSIETIKLDNESNSCNNSRSETNREAFEQLLLACKEIENSERMNLIINKIQKFYDSAHLGYIKSHSFLKLIQKTSELIRKNKDYCLHIKDFIEELRARKTPNTEENSGQNQENVIDFPNIKVKNKKEKIRKLEAAMKKITQILKKLEQKDVDFEDDCNSIYLLQDRYERRLVKIYNKLCELTGEQPSAGRAIKRKFNVAVGVHPSINKAVQDLINKQKEFPDYQDILKIVKSCNEKNSLNLSSAAEGIEARKVFEHIGSELQRRRQADYYLSISDYLQSETDPAEIDPILNSKLKKNHEENKHKIPEIINKYVEKAELMGTKEEVLSDHENSEDEKESEGEESDKSLSDIT